MNRHTQSTSLRAFLTKLFQDVRARSAGPKKRHVVKRAVRGADHEFEPDGTDGDDPGDGLPTVEYDDRLAAANGLEVLAQVGFEVGRAYGSHDHMIVRHVLHVNHRMRRCPELPESQGQHAGRGCAASSVLNHDSSPYPCEAVS